MNTCAYVVGFIKKETGQVEGFSIFSERSPTIHSDYWPFVLFNIEAVDYHEAAQMALEQFWSHPAYSWAHRFASHRLLRDGDAMWGSR